MLRFFSLPQSFTEFEPLRFFCLYLCMSPFVICNCAAGSILLKLLVLLKSGSYSSPVTDSTSVSGCSEEPVGEKLHLLLQQNEFMATSFILGLQQTLIWIFHNKLSSNTS